MQGTPTAGRVLRRRSALAVAWLLVALGSGWLVHGGEQQDRRGLEQRFQARVDTGARFVQSYTADVLARERQLAQTNLQGDVTAEGLQRLVVENGFQAAVVLDSSGRLLAAYPPSPALNGSDLTPTYAHLRQAVAGTPSVSGVVPSAVNHEPVVGFATPFDSPAGRRVLSGAYAVAQTPLRSYLATEQGKVPDAAYLLDAADDVVASGRQDPGPAAVPDSATLAAARRPGQVTTGHGAASREVVTVAVGGTPWRLVFVARRSALLAPLGWSSTWPARIVLLALVLAGLCAVVLLERTFVQRARIAAEQARGRAVLDGAVDAFVGTDVAGRITDWNPAAEQLFGWPAQVALGRRLDQLVLPERAGPGWADGLRGVVPAGVDAPSGPVERAMLHRDGTEIPVEVSVSPTVAGNGSHAFLRDARPRQAGERQMRVLAQVVAAAGDAIFSCDASGRVLSWNSSAERMFGWSADAMVGRSLEHALTPDEHDRVRALVEEVTRSRTVLQGESDSLTSTGLRVQAQLTVAPLLDDLGAPTGVAITARDISERRRLEHELQNSERVFRSAFDHALLGMTLTRLDGTLMRVNQVFADMLGRPVPEFVGMHYEAVMHDESRGRSRDRIRRVGAREIDGFRDEICYVHADGSLVWTEISAALVRDRSGQALHYVTQLLDVTERRATQRERDAREAMMDGIISNSQSLISVKDLEGRYLLVNEPFEQAFGVSEDELLGHTDRYLDPAAAPTWRAHDLRALDGAYQLEESFERDGSRRHYESVRFPLYDADGAAYAICAVSLDVTAQRLAAAAVASARDDALAATAAKSAFLATMSHEIRTPMNAVIGMTGLLLGTDLDDQQRDFVNTVRSSGDALLTLINDILDFSKIESGELQLEKWSFDLAEAVEGALDLVAVPAAAKGLDLVCSLDDSCPAQVVGDLARVRQVLVNLLSNAVKFTPAGDVLLRASAQPHPSGRLALTFTVEDTGIGIPEEGLGRLFQSFRQVDDSTTRVYGGTGLGLAISRRLAQAMDGDLSVRSVPGEGSTFTFTALVEHAVAVPQQSADLTALPADTRVLLVDDNAHAREVLAQQLTSYAGTCTVAGTAEEALAAVAAGAVFDVAVLDHGLPGTGGGQLAEQLRRLSPGRALPVVLLARLGDPPPPEPSPFAAVLTKPVRRAALRHTLTGILLPQQLPARPSPAAAALPPAQRQRVLLAEDNAVNQKVATLMLARLGHHVDVVSNGREAVQALRDVPYDVVLMDVQMPVMDGLEATRRIRADLPTGQQPRIVAMTASVLLEDRDACLAAGMDGYLSKPVREADLRAAVAACTPTRA